MSLFSEIEKTIERGFRRWTERMFGAADSNQLLLVHRAILEEIETKIQTVARGKRVFPYPLLVVTLASDDAGRRAVYRTAFGEEGRLEKDIRDALEGARCELPRGFQVQVKMTASAADTARAFEIEYSSESAKLPPSGPAPLARLTIVKGKAEAAEYTLDKARTNIGRLAELTDQEQRVIRRNDVVFQEDGDEANATVSRKHAHIRLVDGDYRICDEGSEFGTRVFRDGRTIEVPAGNRRGEKLRAGDEIYLGRARLRFER
jgi:ParB-like chromosome segregation protein Spo0J